MRNNPGASSHRTFSTAGPAAISSSDIPSQGGLNTNRQYSS